MRELTPEPTLDELKAKLIALEESLKPKPRKPRKARKGKPSPAGKINFTFQFGR